MEKTLTSIALFTGLVASFLTLFVRAASTWTPILVASVTVLSIALRSWGDGMRFEEEQDHYVRMQAQFHALRTRWEHNKDRAESSPLRTIWRPRL